MESEENPAPKSNFTLADILAEDLPEERTETREFIDINGKKRTITIYADGKVNPERYVALQGIVGEAAMGSQMGKASAFTATEPSGKKLIFTDASFISGLKIMAKVAHSPRFRAEEWAMFAKRVGSRTWNEITSWAEEVNGLTDWFNEQMSAAKNVLSAEETTT